MAEGKAIKGAFNTITSPRFSEKYTVMGFLNFRFTKDSTLLLHAIQRPFYLLILQRTMICSGFKINTKNLRNKKIRVYS
jgi:hypothetical protein